MSFRSCHCCQEPGKVFVWIVSAMTVTKVVEGCVYIRRRYYGILPRVGGEFEHSALSPISLSRSVLSCNDLKPFHQTAGQSGHPDLEATNMPFRRSRDTWIPKIKETSPRSFIASLVIRNALVLEIPTSDDPVTSKSSTQHNEHFRRVVILDVNTWVAHASLEPFGDKFMSDSSVPVAE